MWRFLFGARRLYGDARAVSRGTIHKRVARRAAHRGFGRFLRWLGL